MSDVLSMHRLGFPWQTWDPFLFCVHHDDRYPRGNEQMGPVASLAGRRLGMDFEIRDGWRMYHGEVVPGFPAHPHRGFETLTLARNGFIDHSDSLGARARFGHGDAQWMTAGTGIVHSEMFPLVHRERPNPTELFQIWINLPARHKHVPPHFTMLWNETIPRRSFEDAQGRRTEVTVVAGQLGDAEGPPPPPHSWAAESQHEVAVWTVRMPAHAAWTLPAASAGLNRTVYFFAGGSLRIGGDKAPPGVAIRVRSDVDLPLQMGPEDGELLVLQGKPIGEPVVQHGPFVMNTPMEIQQAYADYRRTRFGGWPWRQADPVHPREEGRFAVHADGRVEKPE